MIRAKFKLSSVTNFPGTTQQRFHFDAVYDASIPENASFTKYTPSGHMEMTVDNPAAQDQLKLGEYYYFDFIPCPTGG